MKRVIFHIFLYFLPWLRRVMCVGMRVFLWCTGAYWGKRKKTVLLIRQDALGDFLISGAYYEEYCRYFHEKGYSVLFVHSPKTEVLAKCLPGIDGHISFSILESSFLGRFLFYRRLARLRAEYAVRLPTLFGSDVEAVLACIYSGAVHRALFRACPLENPQMDGLQEYAWPSPAGWRQRLTRRLFTKGEKILLTDAWKYRGILRYFDMQAKDDPFASVFQQEAALASLVTGRKVAPCARRPDYLPEEEFRIGHEDYFCIVPGSSNPARRWSKENFAAAICQIRRSYPGLHPVLCGVQSEAAFVNEICGLLPMDLPFTNLCGKTTLFQLHYLLKRARLVLSNDTGTAHLAALEGVPVVVLLGGGQFGSYFPVPEYPNVHAVIQEERGCFFCKWLCHKLEDGKFTCVTSLPVSAVMEAVKQILAPDSSKTNHETLR